MIFHFDAQPGELVGSVYVPALGRHFPFYAEIPDTPAWADWGDDGEVSRS